MPMPTGFSRKMPMKITQGLFRDGTMREIFTHRAWNSRAEPPLGQSKSHLQRRAHRKHCPTLWPG